MPKYFYKREINVKPEKKFKNSYIVIVSEFLFEIEITKF